MVLLVMVKVPPLDTPPVPSKALLFAMVLFARVKVPPLATPPVPPKRPVEALSVMVLSIRVKVPELLTPPPPLRPSLNVVVAVLPEIVLLVRVRRPTLVSGH